MPDIDEETNPSGPGVDTGSPHTDEARGDKCQDAAKRGRGGRSVWRRSLSRNEPGLQDLKEADTEALRTIAELTEQRDEVEQELTEAVRLVLQAHRSWSETDTNARSLETCSAVGVRIEGQR